MEYNNPKFRKWLDKLQRESWQLELIISGFAIYALIMALDIMLVKIGSAGASNLGFEYVIWSILMFCSYILTFNLIIHVLLRGLWIGAIGLRYVSGDIDYEKLNYSEKFTTYLKQKVGSFDKYIAQLEDYCSVLFALTFLLVFYVIGFFSVILIIGGFVNLITQFSFLPDNSLKLIKAIIRYTLLITSLITFIDFIGQGILKKKKWTSWFYFPIYRIFSVLTLSFLYRPLTYNFLDNKFGRRLSVFLVPVYVTLGLLSAVYYVDSNFLLDQNISTNDIGISTNYEDESDDKKAFIELAAIPSKVIETPFLKIFIVYNEWIEDAILEEKTGLNLEVDRRGYSNYVITGLIDGFKDSTDVKSKDITLYLETFKNLHSIEIDSINYESNFIVSKNSKNRTGFETYLNIRNLPEGKHLLTITGPTKEDIYDDESKTTSKTIATIPFWYFPENPAPIPLESEITEKQETTPLETTPTQTN